MRAIHRLLLGPPESSDRHRLGDYRLIRILQNLLEGGIRPGHNIPERAARLARPGQGHRTVPIPDQPNKDSQHDREHRQRQGHLRVRLRRDQSAGISLHKDDEVISR